MNEQEQEAPASQGAESHEDRVLALLRSRPDGLTDQEIEDALGLAHQTVCPRRGALAQRGLVAPSGERRKTRSGRTATVWVVVEAPVPGATVKTRQHSRPSDEVIEAVAGVLDTGKSNAEIAEMLGLSPSSVSYAKKALEADARAPTKWDRDLDRLEASLPATAAMASSLAKRLASEPSTKTKEELGACAKNLGESIRLLRELAGALKLQAS